MSGSTSYQTLLTAPKPFPKSLLMETLWFLTHNTEWKSRGQPHGDVFFPGALHRHGQGQGAGGASASCCSLFAFWRASGPGNGAEAFWTAVRGCGRGQLRHSHPVGSEQSSQVLISLQAVLRRPLLLCVGGAEVSKVSGGGHVGAPVTHTTSLQQRPFWDGSVPSPAWVTFYWEPRGFGARPR